MAKEYFFSNPLVSLVIPARAEVHSGQGEKFITWPRVQTENLSLLPSHLQAI